MDSVVKFSFKGITTVVNKDGVEKKEALGMPRWRSITATKIEKGHTAFAYRTGEISGITAFDFDSKDAYHQLVEAHPELKQCKTVQTNKGFHIYFQYDRSIKSTTNYFPSVDIRNDESILYCPPTKYILQDGTIAEYIDLGGELLPVPDYLKKVVVVKEKKKEKLKAKEPVRSEDQTFLKHLIDAGLLSHLSTDYASWVKAGLAFKSIDALELFLLFSKTSPSYDERGCLEQWEKFAPTTIGVGSLYYWAKERDKQTYYALIERKKSLTNEYEIAQVAQCIVQDVFRKDDDFYSYKQYWTKTTDNDLRAIVMNELRQFVMVSINGIVKQTDLENYEEIITRLRAVLNSQINKVNGQKNILDQYRIYMPKVDIELDILQPYYFCFKNCAFDLRTNRRVNVQREDYITQHTGYNYEEPTEEQMQTIEQLVESIFPNPEKRRFYMSVLRTGMIALAFEYMIFATGTGGNGKGLLNGLFADMLGSAYFYKADKKLLTEPMKQGANPEVANIHKKRTVLFSEPEKNSKIQVGTMKELTGGGELNARQLYSGDCRVKLMNTSILEYNISTKPTLNGEIDDAIIRRLRVCEFDQKFVLPEDGVVPEGYRVANPLYKMPDFTSTHRCAFFKYLMTYTDNDLYTPPIIKRETMEYFNTSDDFLGWFETNYELTDDEEDFVPLKDMMEGYKVYLRRISNKSNITRKGFIETLTTHYKLGKLNLFRDRIKIKGTDYRSLVLRVRKLDEW
jgi:phage/plasmid-associated DNA primase